MCESECQICVFESVVCLGMAENDWRVGKERSGGVGRSDDGPKDNANTNSKPLENFPPLVDEEAAQ